MKIEEILQQGREGDIHFDTYNLIYMNNLASTYLQYKKPRDEFYEWYSRYYKLKPTEIMENIKRVKNKYIYKS